MLKIQGSLTSGAPASPAQEAPPQEHQPLSVAPGSAAWTVAFDIGPVWPSRIPTASARFPHLLTVPRPWPDDRRFRARVNPRPAQTAVGRSCRPPRLTWISQDPHRVCFDTVPSTEDWFSKRTHTSVLRSVHFPRWPTSHSERRRARETSL